MAGRGEKGGTVVTEQRDPLAALRHDLYRIMDARDDLGLDAVLRARVLPLVEAARLIQNSGGYDTQNGAITVSREGYNALRTALRALTDG